MTSLNMIPVIVAVGILLLCVAVALVIAGVVLAVMRHFNACKTSFIAATVCVVFGGVLLIIANRVISNV